LAEESPVGAFDAVEWVVVPSGFDFVEGEPRRIRTPHIVDVSKNCQRVAKQVASHAFAKSTVAVARVIMRWLAVMQYDVGDRDLLRTLRAAVVILGRRNGTRRRETHREKHANKAFDWSRKHLLNGWCFGVD
jgi:hypothetical protein